MKKTLKIILLAGITILTLAACGSESTAEVTEPEDSSAEEDKVIRVGATGQSFPNSYKENDQLVGFDVEVFEAISEHLGYEVEWTLASFDGLLGQLSTGKLDSIANAFEITDERKETYDFTDPYTYTSTAIAVLEDSSYASVADLESQQVGGVVGSNKVTILEQYIEETGIDIEIRQYDTREGPQTDTEKGQVAGYVQAKSILQATINQGDLPLRILPDELAQSYIAFPFAKTESGEKLLTEFNQGLAEIREEGLLSELSVKYFGEDITEEAAE